MPVFGHTLIGLATAIEGAPETGIPRRASAWIPAIVALAYFPDIVGHLPTILGHRYTEAGHSLFLAVPVAVALGWLLNAVFRLAPKRAFMIASISLLLHLVPDAILCGWGRIGWPLFHTKPGSNTEQQHSVNLELLIFGGMFIAYLYVRWWRRPELRDRLRMRLADMLSAGTILPTVFIGCLLAVIAITYSMGILREHQIQEAYRLRGLKQYDAALAMFERGYHWPKTHETGRLDYVRGDIALSRGDRESAEHYFLKAYAADPSYFWVVIDLAVFYASSHEPLAERRTKAEPYIRRLDQDFQSQDAYHRYRSKLAKKLELPSTAPATHHDS